jgi:hypothetical protein
MSFAYPIDEHRFREQTARQAKMPRTAITTI